MKHLHGETLQRGVPRQEGVTVSSHFISEVTRHEAESREQSRVVNVCTFSCAHPGSGRTYKSQAHPVVGRSLRS